MTDDAISAALSHLPDYLGWHVLLSVSALVLGIAISLPLAIFSARRPALRAPVLAIAGVIQTIPSLALLALFYPTLLALSVFTRATFGFGFRALGFLPALAALTLYSMLPILRNTIAGLLGVDRAALIAAKGVGMTGFQSLRLVELPLAAPIILAGIRTAAVCCKPKTGSSCCSAVVRQRRWLSSSIVSWPLPRMGSPNGPGSGSGFPPRASSSW
jgi:osmoprotectant transport system permease protein